MYNKQKKIEIRGKYTFFVNHWEHKKMQCRGGVL